MWRLAQEDLNLAFIPFLLQGAVIIVDEFHFHRKRGLSRWERIGHPLDTLTLLVPLGLAMLRAPTRSLSFVFLGMSLFSVLFVTKDEWVHAHECKPTEHWQHAILFIFHPLVFVSTYLLWPHLHEDAALMRSFACAFAAIALLFAHQILYWNVLRKE